MKEFRTSWCKEGPPYGAFDDYIILESKEGNESVLIRPEEFYFLCHQLLDNFIAKKSKYIQLLKEWNEGVGFNGIEEVPSVIKDKEDTIYAIKLIEGVDKMVFAKITQTDLRILLAFLIRNKKTEIKIRKE